MFPCTFPVMRHCKTPCKCRLPKFVPGDPLHFTWVKWGFAFLTSVPVESQHWTIWGNVCAHWLQCSKYECVDIFFMALYYWKLHPVMGGPNQHLDRTCLLSGGPNVNLPKTRGSVKWLAFLGNRTFIDSIREISLVLCTWSCLL